MYSILKNLWSILSPKEKLITLALLIMMVISSVLELLGIGLLMPVIALFTKPELIEQNKYLKLIHDFINPSSNSSFLITLCIILIVLYIGKNLFLIFQNYVQTHFILKKGAKLANKMFSNYIHAPYKYHLTHNSGYLMGNINLAYVFTGSVLVPFMILATDSIVVISIIIMLLFISPLITIGLSITILIMTLVIYYALKNTNYTLGKTIQIEMLEMNKYALQGLKAIKESKIRNAEDFFSNEYAKHRNIYNHTEANVTFINNLPRFIIETMIVITGLGTLLILILTDVKMGSIILLLSLFAASAIRLMPSMSRIQYSLSRVKQSMHSFNTLYKDISGFEIEDKGCSNDKLSFNNAIEINNLSFAYENSTDKIFTDYSLKIKKNSSVAFIGPTGCGKTTLVDIILGLLKPQQGSIEIDGVNINECLHSWQTIIGYVPQFIFLLDDTVKANVAFGTPTDKVDDNRVIECLKMAQVYEFIAELSDDINHMIGENGIQLSGGQRQRIGIARALYHNPEVLILDEATSALDNETEKAFIDALDNLKGKLTIIMIAHRLTTVENCDEIIKLK